MYPETPGTARGVDPAVVAAIEQGVADAASVTDPAPPAERAGTTADRGSEPDDETRVLAMLDRHDGRMRQSEIVSKTGWSKSKVSTVLSGMSDRGLVTKLPVGRQNVIFRKGEEPSIVATGDGPDRS